MEIPSNNTIFLQGIFFNEVKTIEDKMMEETLDRENNIDNFNNYKTNLITIPNRFKNIKSWIESTKNLSLRCWYCNLSFHGVPCFIPKHIISGSNGKEFDTYGWFCGFACAYTFLIKNAEYRVNKTFFDKINMLKILYTNFYKRKVKDFYEAPDIYNLTSYGGYIDLENYKSELKEINQKIMKESIPIKQ